MMQNKQNMLILTPIRKANLMLEQDGDVCVVCLPRTTLLEKLAIKWFHQPTHRRVRLDRLGSFVMRLCDGTHSVSEIAQRVEAQFGAKAAPVLDRLLAFFTILEANDWIELYNKDEIFKKET